MSIIENNIAFPTKVGKPMGMIFILLIPYVIVQFLREFGLFTSIGIAALVCIPFAIMAAIYIYFWIKHDENNNETNEMLQILRDRNEIEANKRYYSWR